MTTPQEWWEDHKYMAVVAGKSFCKVYDVPAIIQEAQRMERDRIATIIDKEVPGLVASSGTNAGWNLARNKILTLLTPPEKE